MNKHMENHELQELENRLAEEGKNYRNIPVPEELKEKVEAAAEKGGKISRFRIPAAMAAAVALLVLLPNTGADIAYAMGNLPVIGKVFQAVTFRDYRYEDERFNADVEVPQIVVEDTGAVSGESVSEESAAESEQLQETLEQVNFDIEEVTDRLIEEFMASAQLGESYGTLEIHHETVTDNEQYFTLKLSIFQAEASGAQSYQYYTIDKRSGERIQIGDLFREDSGYAEVLSEDIRNQMRAAMAEDEMNMYWVDSTDMPELNWEGIREDQNFYFDDKGNLVIVFDEYEVAPGYMGAQEFTVERAVFENLLK